MNPPIVRRVQINEGPKIMGSYLDDEYVFHIIEGDEWMFTMNNHEYRVDANSLLLIPPRILHLVQPTTEVTLAHWVVHFEWIQGSRVFKDFPLVIQVDEATRAQASRLFEKLLVESRKKQPCDWMESGILLQMLSIYRANVAQSLTPPNAKYPSWIHIENALRLMQEQFQHKDLNIAEISEACGLSHAHFSRIFQQAVGMSPIRYLNLFRIEKAKALLINSDLNNSEIARRCGYNDSSRFGKCFRKVEKTSPGQWRQRYGQHEREK